MFASMHIYKLVVGGFVFAAANALIDRSCLLDIQNHWFFLSSIHDSSKSTCFLPLSAHCLVTKRATNEVTLQMPIVLLHLGSVTISTTKSCTCFILSVTPLILGSYRHIFGNQWQFELWI